MDAAAEGILDGEDGSIGDPELDGLESDLELIAGDCFAIRVGLAGGGLAVGARDALVGDAELRAVHRSRGEIGDGQGLWEVADGYEIQSGG